MDNVFGTLAAGLLVGFGVGAAITLTWFERRWVSKDAAAGKENEALLTENGRLRAQVALHINGATPGGCLDPNCAYCNRVIRSSRPAAAPAGSSSFASAHGVPRS